MDTLDQTKIDSALYSIALEVASNKYVGEEQCKYPVIFSHKNSHHLAINGFLHF